MTINNEGYRAWIDLGDILLEQGRPHSAAEIYFNGWERFPESPVPLYHSGRALIAAGKVTEGEHRIAVAHRLSLGNARNRGRFLEELGNRGRLKDLRTERDLVLKTVWQNDSYHGNVWSQLSRASMLLKDYDTAASAVDLYCNFIFKSNSFTFIDGRSYLDMPVLVPMNRALSLATAGKIDEAMVLAREVLATVPGHAVLTTTLVPLLEQRGFKKEADEIFQTSWQTYRKMMVEYPQSAWAAGWSAHIAANCNRELDLALDDAKKGVALDLDSKWNREVLAETHFRRGETADAVAVMKLLATETPRNQFYRRQLTRFAGGDRNTPQPLGPDD
ncbi:hypothetical protein BH11PLA2_BH11PLA2_42050 [soil metagenome]